MHEAILHVRDLGHETFWRVLHDAALTDDPRQCSSALQGRTVALLMAANCAEAQLSFSAGVVQQGGNMLSLHPGQWRTDVESLALQASSYAAHAHLLITHALPHNALAVLAAQCRCPVLNGGNDKGDPCAALADLALMQALTPALDTVRVAWVGGASGLAHSLIEAAIYAPFELFMALPSWGEPDHDMLGLALKAGAKIFLTREPQLALDAAHYVYAGAGPSAVEGAPLEAGLALAPELMACARPDAKVFSGAPLTTGCRIDSQLLDVDLHAQRLEYRLRVHKTLLPLLCAAGA